MLGKLFFSFLMIAFADVTPSNGKFYQEFTFFSPKNKNFPPLQVTYNSRTSYRGFFGWGWSTEYEASLQPGPEGFTLIENGEGAKIHFLPTHNANENLNKIIDSITQQSKASGVFLSSQQEQKFRDHLKSDPEFRAEHWEELRRLKKVQNPKFSLDTLFTSHDLDQRTLQQTKDGFQIKYQNKAVQFFSAEGRLEKISDSQGATLRLFYSPDGRLSKLKSDDEEIRFLYNEVGLVRRVEEAGAQQGADFEYDKESNLVHVDSGPHRNYHFTYDETMHLLLQEQNEIQEKLEISYFPKRDKNQGKVKEVKSPNGDTDSYTYEGNPLEAGSYKMEISTKDKNGKVIFTKSITVLTKLRNGILAKEKESTSVNGSVHREQYYDDCCANPIRVKDGSGETSYRYDDSGLMLEKITKLETLKIQYSPTCRLPVRIDHLTSAKNSSETRWTEISYDSQCRAIAGKTSSHQSFSASYDGQDRPISISLGSKPIQRWELVYKKSGSIPDQIKDSTSGLNKNDPTEIKKILARASQQISKILSETRLANTDF